MKHTGSPTDKSFPFDIPDVNVAVDKVTTSASTSVRRVVTFSMPSGAKWKASQSSLRSAIDSPFVSARVANQSGGYKMGARSFHLLGTLSTPISSTCHFVLMLLYQLAIL